MVGDVFAGGFCELILRVVFATIDVISFLAHSAGLALYVFSLEVIMTTKETREMRYYVSLKFSLMHVSGTKLAAARLDQRCFVTASNYFDLRYLVDP